MKKIRRLPTILGLLILIIGIAGGIILLSRSSNLFSQAEPTIIPKQPKITNVTYSSFTVSWITDGQTVGLVKFGRDQNVSQVANDDRDENSGNNQKYYTHHVTVKNLDPNAVYYFKIGSDKKTFDDNGQPYNISTAAEIQGSPPESDLAYGTVTNNDNTPATDALVYLSLANASPQSTYISDGGSFLIPLNQALSADLSSYAAYDKQNEIENLFIQGGVQTATATATTGNDSPLPTIILGQDNNFQDSSPESTTEPTSIPISKFTFEQLQPPTEISEEITIANPTEGEPINSTKPAIMGTGPAKESLTIIVESTSPITQNVTTDSQGNWEWSPPEDLEPGNHKITVSYTDENGILHTLSRSFVVLAAESSDLPAFESTPSATLAITKTPTASPILTATPSPTIAITGTKTPTVSLTPTKTSTPTLIPTTTTTPSSNLQPGTLKPTFFLSVLGAALIVIGFLAVI